MLSNQSSCCIYIYKDSTIHNIWIIWIIWYALHTSYTHVTDLYPALTSGICKKRFVYLVLLHRLALRHVFPLRHIFPTSVLTCWHREEVRIQNTVTVSSLSWIWNMSLSEELLQEWMCKCARGILSCEYRVPSSLILGLAMSTFD